MSILIFFLLLGTCSFTVLAQTKQKRTYYDAGKTQIKEWYHIHNVDTHLLEGMYHTYYMQGNLKTTGFYKQNIACSTWTYYFQNSKIKSQGNIEHFEQYGPWKYYYESGALQMEGTLEHGKKTGFWKNYYENGKLKSEGLMKDNLQYGLWKYFHEDGGFKAEAFFHKGKGHYKEFYEGSTLVKMEGRIVEGKSDSIWKYYYPNESLKAIGQEKRGLREGKWILYHENGNVSAEGMYKNGHTEGLWKYYYDNGTLLSQGMEDEGKKQGLWKSYYKNGAFKAEAHYELGEGAYTEFYPEGKVKMKGFINKGMYENAWLFYDENGLLEGECSYKEGVGEYVGFYPDNTKKMEGTLKNGDKIGVWKLYKENGQFAGYYRTYYEDQNIKEEGAEALRLVNPNKPDTLGAGPSPSTSDKKSLKPGNTKKIKYFRYKTVDHTSFIVSFNPLSTFTGTLPMYFEYYVHEKYGFEYFFFVHRNPFFDSKQSFEIGKVFTDGYSMGVKFKRYQKLPVYIGMPYWALEMRYRNLQNGAFAIDTSMSTSIKIEKVLQETAYEFSLLVGDRFMKNYKQSGLSFDLYFGLGLGLRNFSQNFLSTQESDAIFSNISNNKISIPLRFGFALGYSF